MIFDSHAHLISTDQTRYPPAPLRGALTPGEFDDPMTAEKLLALMDKMGVARACAVQRAHVYGYHNDYVLDSAERYPHRFSAVVVLNAADPTTPQALQTLRRERKATGVRFTAPSFPIASLDWLTSPEAHRSWVAATDLGMTVCIHVLHVQRDSVLPALKRRADEFPQTRLVVDHVGGAHAAQVELDYLRAQGKPIEQGVHPTALALSENANVVMKLSSINLERLEEAQLSLSAFLVDVVQRFGADRVIWGSDIGQSRGDYGHMVAMAVQAASALNDRDRQAVLFGTAARLYGGA